MSASPKPASRSTAFIVLLLALAATAFVFLREHKIAVQNKQIRMQDALAQLHPHVNTLLMQRFETLRDQAKITLRGADFSQASWSNFVKASEWRQRFPGMKEIGYVDFSADKCVVRASDAITTTPHMPGFDLCNEPTIRVAVQQSADAGYSIASKAIPLGTNKVIIGLLNLTRVDQRPASAAENRANLRGFVFFALDQKEFFAAIQPQLKNLPLDLRLLGPDEPAVPKTETQRTISYGNLAGDWRFAVTLKAPSVSMASQWIVLFGGVILSLLLYSLFATQAKLRFAAEQANEKILLRDSEILALNRGLEQKVEERTAQLNEALAEEKELNKLKSNFISMVTHEIRTPLALILGSSEILSRYLDRLPSEKRTEHLKTIESSVHRMSGLLEDVLLFSKTEAGRLDFNPTELDLKQFCTKLVDELLSATNRRCPIELSCSISDAARADENLLRPILSNLITNAVKYSPAGTPVKFIASRECGDAIFVVEDRGMGIPAEDRKRLFTPFCRGKNVATIQGTGLGLVIAKHCVERHGGDIEIESVEKSGTTVRVRLPLFSPAHTEFIRRISSTPQT